MKWDEHGNHWYFRYGFYTSASSVPFSFLFLELLVYVIVKKFIINIT